MKHFPLQRLQRLRPLAIPFARLALSFLLTAARLSGGYAPFALALTAASGAGLPGLLCLAGTGAGSLVFLDFQEGLRHFAAALLIFASHTAFYDTQLYDRPLFRPCISAFMMLLVQSVYLLGRAAEQWALCIASAALLAVGTHLWRRLRQQPDRPAVLFLLAGLASAAQRIPLTGVVSPGRVLSGVTVLWTALELPAAEAVCVGAALGALLDLSAAGPRLLLCGVWGGAAALVSLGRRWSRWTLPPLFALGAGFIALLFRADYPAAIFFESLLAALAVLPLRRRPRPARLEAAPPSPELPRLRQSAAALRELYDSFFRNTAAVPPENPSVLFDQAAERVCRDCVLCPSCWQQQYGSTYNAFNDACPKLLQRGRAEPQDFPSYFSSRCVRFSEFLAAVNAELRAFLLRRQYRQRLSEVRQQAQEQYQQLGEALASTAVHAISNVTVPQGCRIGSSLRPKEGERLCGDQLASFEVGPTLYLLLSDGMGSGEAAHREAALTVRLLQQFLQAGIDAAPALQTLNSALRLRGESGGSFTTIDLLALDRGSGAAAVYKYGAAPSYVKRAGTVSRITAQSLPAGLDAEPPETTRISLQPGCWFVMISDGVADETNDRWLQELLARWQGQDVNALISLILSESRSREGLRDDCAVLALQLPESGGKSRV